jgi:hypothetical protein
MIRGRLAMRSLGVDPSVPASLSPAVRLFIRVYDRLERAGRAGAVTRWVERFLILRPHGTST